MHTARRSWPWLLPALALLAAPAVAAPPTDVVPDRLLVKLRPGVEAVRQAGGRWRLADAGATGALVDPAVRSVRRAGRHAPARGDVAAAVGLDRNRVIEVAPGADLAALADALRARGDLVEAVDFDGIGGPASFVPDDPSFGLQYALRNTGQNVQGQTGIAGADIKAYGAWDYITGSPDVVIAIVDAGMDEHVELGGRILPGWNVVADSADTSDACQSHGTHVAGVAAASGDDGVGIAGVNWSAPILPVRVIATCSGSESDLADGIVWAVDHGAGVINLSLQYGVGSQYLHDAVSYAYAQDVVMVAASGNNGFSGGVAFPGRWPETITVAATDNADLHAPFSNSGPEVDLAAPGDDIYSLFGTSSYAYKFGTSFAAPAVSGVAALLRQLDPALTVEDIRAVLTGTAHDLYASGFDELTGWGRLDAGAAVESVVGAPMYDPDVNLDGVVDVADLVDVILRWGPCGTGPCREDLDDNFVVDVFDLVFVIINWSP